MTPHESLIDSLDENDEIDKIILAKIGLTSLIDKPKMLEFFRSIIDSSECFEFSSNRARRFINPNIPNLNLKFDIATAKIKYPDLAKDLEGNSSNSDESFKAVKIARAKVANIEITDSIKKFFNAFFSLVLTGGIPQELIGYVNLIDEITTVDTLDSEKLENLRSTLNNVFDIKDKKTGKSTGRQGFSFGITTAVNFLEDLQSINDDPRIFIEIMY